MRDERNEKRGHTVGEMHKRRETMTDGRRYIIFYNFENNDESETMKNETAEKDFGSSDSSFDAFN